jgi:hypothetical protein
MAALQRPLILLLRRERMASKPFTIEQCLALLQETPERIAAMTEGLTPAQLRSAPSDGEWSLVGVLAHLRACADMWGAAMLRIITEDHPAFVAVNPRAWIKKTDYPALEFGPSFRAFCSQRAELLATLERLPREGWDRTATVRVWGVDAERTVLHYGDRLARHERAHVKQIKRVVEALNT